MGLDVAHVTTPICFSTLQIQVTFLLLKVFVGLQRVAKDTLHFFLVGVS